MRYALFAIPFALLAAPAVAAQAEQPGQVRIPTELTDPRTAERIAGMTDALSKALLDLPVGEIEAAAEGRPATAADRRRTIRDVARATEPEIERKLAESGPKVRAAMQAFSAALPAITEALSEAAEKIERATANMPQPGYPKY
jgi:hypothetical protein